MPLKAKAEVRRDHVQPLDLGQRVDQLVGHPVAEVLVLRVGAQVGEGQHRDRARQARLRRRRRRAPPSCPGIARWRRPGSPPPCRSGPPARAPARVERLVQRRRHFRPTRLQARRRLGEAADELACGGRRRTAARPPASRTARSRARRGRCGRRPALARGLLRAHVGRRAAGSARSPVSPSAPAASSARAMPKSATSAPSSCSRMFSGLMSRWTTPWRWAYVQRRADLAGDRAAPRPRAAGARGRAGRGAISPSTYGIAYQRSPSVSPESNSGRMWGCCRRAASRISRRKRSGPSSGGDLRVQHLERDRPVVPEVVRQVDRGHAAATQLALHRVAVRQGNQTGSEVGHRCFDAELPKGTLGGKPGLERVAAASAGSGVAMHARWP